MLRNGEVRDACANSFALFFGHPLLAPFSMNLLEMEKKIFFLEIILGFGSNLSTVFSGEGFH